MASLANQTISSSYDGLIKTATDQPVPVSGVQLLEDGAGNSLAISIGQANQGVTITGALAATSLSGVLVDGVTATTQSPGDNSTKVATTAYVDAQVTASDLDFAGDSGTGAVDLDSQTFTIAGTANEIETVASGQTVTIGLPSSVTVGTLNATTLGGTLSTAAQPNITSVGTLSSLAVSGNLTVDTNTLYVDAANNRVGIGGTPDRALHVFDRVAFSNSDDTGSLLFVPSATINSIFSRAANGSSTAVDLNFLVGSTEAMRIDSSGNVGIGTSSPNYPLQVEVPDGNRVSFTGASSNLDFFPTISGVTRISTGQNFEIKAFLSDLIFGTGGGATERMRIDSSGRVLINGATSGTALSIRTLSGMDALIRHEVSANPTAYYTLFGTNYDFNKSFVINNKGSEIMTYSDSTAFGLGLDGGASNLIRFSTNNAERMRIAANGNVGIGTGSPSYTLHTSATGVSRVEVDCTDNQSSGVFFKVLSGGTMVGNGTIATQNNGDMKFFTGTSSEAERMRITSGGNVGIGTSSPDSSYSLDVYGDMHVGAGSLNKGLEIGPIGFTASLKYNPNGNLEIKPRNNYSTVFLNGTTERMRITSGGFLKASNTGSYFNATGAYHEISSNTSSSTVLSMRNSAVSDPYGIYLGFSNASPNNTSNYFFAAVDSTNDKAIIYSNGTYGSRTNTYGAILSDERYKENIVDTSPKLDKIMQVKVRNFNLIGDDLKQIGVIAQEVEQIFPSLVYERELIENIETVDEEGNVTSEIKPTGETAKAVKDSIFTYILLKAVQEQQEIINDLKTRIETLETK